MNYVGVPVGLSVGTVAPAMRTTFSARLEETMLLSRLRWSVPVRGLVLIDARLHKDSIASQYPNGPLLPLVGDGTWRFPALVARVSMQISIIVENLSADMIYPGPIAFWGLTWEDLTPRQRWEAIGSPGLPPGKLP